MGVKPSEVRVWWKRRNESLESLRLGTILKNPSVDEDDSLTGIQNIGQLPPIPFNSTTKIDIFYQSVSGAGKCRKIAWLTTKVYKTLQNVGGIDSDDTELYLNNVTNLEVGDLLRVERELMEITAIGSTVVVNRGQHGTTAVAHTQNTLCFKVIPSVPYNSKILDGRTDALSAPTGLSAVGRRGAIAVFWNNYTGSNRKLVRSFKLYRNTTPSPPASPLVEIDADSYVDYVNDTNVYYYWVSSLDTCGNESEKSSYASAQALELIPGDEGVPNAPYMAVEAGKLPNETVRFVIGVEKPTSNNKTIDFIQIQITTSNDPNFNNPIFDEKFGGDYANTSYLTTKLDVFLFRARAHNSIGYSEWCSTITKSTMDVYDYADSDVPGLPQNVTVKVDDAYPAVPGKEMIVEWDRPSSNFLTLFSYAVQIYTSSTFPGHVVYDTGTNGVISRGGNVLTDTSKGWTTNALVGKFVFIYNGSMEEGDKYLAFTSKIISNTSNTITIEDKFRDSGTKNYKVVTTPEWERVSISRDEYTHILAPQVGRGKTHFVVVVSNLPLGSYYVRVGAVNELGQRWTTPVGPYTIDGIKGEDIKDRTLSSSKIDYYAVGADELADGAAVTNKIGTGAVTSPKTSIPYLSDITVNCGTITAGTIVGATIKTAQSGARVEMAGASLTWYDQDNTLRGELACTGATHLYVGGGTIVCGNINSSRSISAAAKISGGGLEGGYLYLIAGGSITCGDINSSGSITAVSLNVGSGSISGGSLNVSNGSISGGSLNVGSGSVTCGGISCGSISAGGGIGGASLNVGSGSVTCGNINSSGTVSANAVDGGTGWYSTGVGGSAVSVGGSLVLTTDGEDLYWDGKKLAYA